MWKPRRLVNVLAAILICLAAAGHSAYADSGTYFTRRADTCHFSSGVMKWRDSTASTTYGNGAVNAVSSWNSQTSDITVTQATTGAQIDVGLEALPANDTFTWGKTYFPSCTNTFWQATVSIKYNTTNANGSTATQRKQIMIHEFGHAFGLEHWTANLCSQLEMMNPAPVSNSCGYSDVRLGDAGGVNSIY